MFRLKFNGSFNISITVPDYGNELTITMEEDNNFQTKAAAIEAFLIFKCSFVENYNRDESEFDLFFGNNVEILETINLSSIKLF